MWFLKTALCLSLVVLTTANLSAELPINMNSRVKAQRARVAATPSEVPEGYYAWFVLLSCFMVFGLTFGVIKAFGVFFVEIHHYYETTATRTSWITSIAVAVIHLGGDYHNIHIFLCYTWSDFKKQDIYTGRHQLWITTIFLNFIILSKILTFMLCPLDGSLLYLEKLWNWMMQFLLSNAM